MKFSNLLLAVPLIATIAIAGTTAAFAAGIEQFANLQGSNEIGGGDTNGYGAAAVTFHSTRKICVGLVVDRIAIPTAAHIHQGVAGVNGPIVVSFPKIPGRGNPGSSSFCADIDSTLAGQIQGNPAGFYVNVHNADFPGGALRGQLFTGP